MQQTIEIRFASQTVTGTVDFDYFPGERGSRDRFGVQLTPDFGPELTVNDFVAKEFDTSNMRVMRKGNEDKFELLDLICLKRLETSPEDYLGTQ